MAIIYIILLIICGVPFLLAIAEASGSIAQKGINYLLDKNAKQQQKDQDRKHK